MINELHPIVVQIIEWRRIMDFPGYSISSAGFARNDETGRHMALLVNQGGVVNVGLTRNRVQYKRAVALLVAKAFLTVCLQDAFDTPINLDGDRYNNRVDNLAWRPRWFAAKYFRQFDGNSYEGYRIEDIDTHEIFNDTWDAATKLGLLQADIIRSVHTGMPVWPTNQRFRPIE